jgi:alanine racemase
MTRSICRRRFLSITASAAAMAAAPLKWAKAESSATAPARPLNDYLVAEISSSALKANLALMRRQLKPQTKLCAVVKANCYGHGWLECKDAIAAEADWLAVARPEEAVAIRQSGCRLPVLLLMATGFPSDMRSERLKQLIAQDITLTVAAAGDLASISSAAAQLGKPANVHIKIDTGMSRSGVLADAAPDLIHQARRQSNVALTGLYTHFAMADAADKTSTKRQFARFQAAVRAAGSDTKGLMLHAANSAATIDLPETHLDMVRVGTATYGHQPSDEMQRHLPLRGVLRIVGRIAQAKEVPAGSYVGYGETYRFERPARIGLVPIGYADGYSRCFSNRAVMRIQGRDVPVRGRVSMDQTVIDLTGFPEVKIGDDVEIVSPDPEAPNSIETLARLADTIPYEILCRFGSRIRRIPAA